MTALSKDFSLQIPFSHSSHPKVSTSLSRSLIRAALLNLTI
ncbi:hypothetical protein GXM_02307 [Nostoc sphaeroides CCNUC1]|uniref:Uncharacterized protein n=1 Tax=Nostoc sphaeroides CCNUC1 TaxID=2653204 RepID=A0A5P8VWP5_9NOSO|nr:hypothetical protein GXM_02307 [Nostoc sphaeroides CCNUC1]